MGSGSSASPACEFVPSSHHLMTKAADVSPSCQWPSWLPCLGWSRRCWSHLSSSMCLWLWKVNALILINSSLFFEPSEVRVAGCNEITCAKPILQSTDCGPFLAITKYLSPRAWQFYGCSKPWAANIRYDHEMFASGPPHECVFFQLCRIAGGTFLRITRARLLLNSFRFCQCTVFLLCHPKKGRALPAEPVMWSLTRVHQHSLNPPRQRWAIK